MKFQIPDTKVVSARREAAYQELSSKANISSGKDLQGFISYIEPFFYGQSVTFVEVGAFEGQAFCQFVASRLRIVEAHLFEPNPDSFEVLRKIASAAMPRGLHLHAFALGARKSILRMRKAHANTRVIGKLDRHTTPPKEEGDTFSIKSTTLDDIAKKIRGGHISLLKLDVEGFEQSVLAGASKLLKLQKIDMAHIEIADWATNERQKSFRAVDKFMSARGYRLLHIYDQIHERESGAPVLRRLHLAYLSKRFAESLPLELIKELSDSRADSQAQKTVLEETRKQIDEMQYQVEMLQGIQAHGRKEIARLRDEIARRDIIEAKINERLSAALEKEKQAVTRFDRVTTERKELAFQLKQATRDARDADAKNQELRTTLEKERQAVAHLNEKLADAKSAARERIETLDRLLAERDGALEKLSQDFDRTVTERENLALQIEYIRNSLSWRITAPFRNISTTANRVILRTKQMAASIGKVIFGASTNKSSIPQETLALTPKLTPRLNKAKLPKKERSKNYARVLEDKLWGGFSRYALNELEALKGSGKPYEAVRAAFALASWHAAEGSFSVAYENITHAHAVSPARRKPTIAETLLESYCLVRLERSEEARNLISPLLEELPNHYDLCLAMANTYAVSFAQDNAEIDSIRLSWINRVYENAGILPVSKADRARALTVDNLSVRHAHSSPESHLVKVSIIVPTYNAANTLAVTLKSILAQTWTNLEIIVVDDCSIDDTFDIIEEYARRDPRIIPLRLDRNQGSYAARNRGLAAATGDFITIHDSNDWSHAQKIELQALNLLKNDHVMANYSNWARVQRDMLFVGKFRQKDRITDWNPSSFFFRKKMIERVGGWDRVRISADAEFVRRSKRAWPDWEFSTAINAAPLAFGYDTEASLTKHSDTHGRTIYHGVRREYHEAAAHWLAAASAKELYFDDRATERPFPAPGPILPDRRPSTDCDLLFIDDFNFDDGARTATMKDIYAALEQRRSVAIVQWRLYNQDVTQPLTTELRDLARNERLSIVAPGARVNAGSVVVTRPAVLQHAMDLFPRVEFGTLFVVTDRATDIYDSTAARANLVELFGNPGIWASAAEVLASLENPNRSLESPAQRLNNASQQ